MIPRNELPRYLGVYVDPTFFDTFRDGDGRLNWDYRLRTGESGDGGVEYFGKEDRGE